MIFMSCTIKRQPVTEVTKSDDPLKEVPILQDDAKSSQYILPSQSASQIYQTMLDEEKKSGKKIEKDVIHTTRGTLNCEVKENLQTCLYWIRVDNKEFLKGPHKITKPLTTKLITFFQKTNSSILKESVAKGDLICDFIGKKSPPFGMEKLECKVLNARASNEAIIENRTAENLVNILRGEIPFTAKTTSVHGSMLCQWMKGSNRTPCVVRPIVDGALKDKFLEVSAKNSASIANLLLEAIKDEYIYTNKTNHKFKTPKEIIGSIVCSVNSEQFDVLGKRDVVCRVSI